MGSTAECRSYDGPNNREILRALDELRMKNIGTFSLGEGSALLSQTGSIDRAAETKLEAGLPVGVTHRCSDI